MKTISLLIASIITLYFTACFGGGGGSTTDNAPAGLSGRTTLTYTNTDGVIDVFTISGDTAGTFTYTSSVNGFTASAASASGSGTFTYTKTEANNARFIPTFSEISATLLGQTYSGTPESVASQLSAAGVSDTTGSSLATDTYVTTFTSATGGTFSDSVSTGTFTLQ